MKYNVYVKRNGRDTKFTKVQGPVSYSTACATARAYSENDINYSSPPWSVEILKQGERIAQVGKAS